MGYTEAPGQDIVLIGGGNGLSVVADGLREAGMADHVAAAIVTVYDNGGSTGLLREQYPDMLAPGDIRRVLAALATDRVAAQKFNDRLSNGHAAGNLELVALAQELGSFDLAIAHVAGRLGVSNSVIPASLQPATLVMRHYDDDIVGEHNIGEFPVTDPFATLSLEPPVSAHPDAIRAIARARKIVIAPGSIRTSLGAALLPAGLVEAIQGNEEAELVVIANLHAEPGQNPEEWHVADHARSLGELIGRDPDWILHHVGALPNGEQPLGINPEGFRNITARIIAEAMATTREDGRTIHDGAVVAKLLHGLISSPESQRHEYAWR